MRQQLIIRDDIILSLPAGPVGVSFSGGADSTLLAYFVLSQLREHPTHFFTLSMLTRNFIQHYRTSVVLAELCKITENYNIYQHITCGNYDNNTTSVKMFDTPREFAINYGIVKSILAGGNANPPNDVIKNSKFFINGKATLDEERSPLVTRPIKCNSYRYAPFHNLNKQDIINLYKDHGLEKNLLPLTQSCSTDPPCGDCWFCFEREWGMQVLN